MTSGADPFSILSKNNAQTLTTSSYPAPKQAPKIRRYRPGVKPTFEKAPEDESSDSDDFDMFSDNKTEISKFTQNTGMTQLSGLETLGMSNRSRIIKKNINVLKESKVSQNKKRKDTREALKEVDALLGSQPISLLKRSKAAVQKRDFFNEHPVEKKLKIDPDAKVVTVTRRNRRRGIIQSTESNDISSNVAQIKEDNQELGVRKRVVMSTQETQKVRGNEKESSDTEEYSDSDDSGEESSEEFVNTIKRPVFIRKEDRYMQEQELQEELHAKLEQNRIKQSIKEQNKQIVIESKSKREDAIDHSSDIFGSDSELPNDTDDDPENAYKLWRQRELARLKRDREEREKEFLEKEKTERRRLMTDEERAREDKKIGKYKKSEKSNLQFMQKYYHKGIFGNTSDPLFNRDYNIGVGTDNYDKSNLPKALQVRRGWEHKRGRSKYTHLGDQDTTNFDPDWGVHEDLKNKFMNKMGGYKSSNAFNRPSRRSKR